VSKPCPTVSNFGGAWGVSRVPVYRHGHGRARTLARKPCPNPWTRPLPEKPPEMTAIMATENAEEVWEFDKLGSHYNVTITLPSGQLHVASWSLPRVQTYHADLDGVDRISGVEAFWIDDPAYADEMVGWVDWPAVQAITWRWVE
jgi:hypothetical protein